MKKTILVVDDDVAILDIVTQMLQDAGYNTLNALDGDSAIAMINKKPDLVLLDMWMSGTDGRDVCLYIKKNPKTKHIPVIISSANNDTKNISEEIGADDYLAKPFEMEELLNKIKKTVSS